MPTPMPGTNIGFSDHDLIRKSDGNATSSKLPSEPTGYFDVPTDQIHQSTESENTAASCVKPADGRVQDSSADDSIYAYYTDAARDLLHESPVSMRKLHQHICDPSHARCIYPRCEKQRAHDTKTRRDSHTRSRAAGRGSTDSASSVLDIGHIVFDGASDCSLPKYGQHEQTLLVLQADRDSETNTLDHDAVSSFPQPPTRAEHAEGFARTCWGTKGILYDGTGYGDTSNSSSARPSLSSPVVHAPSEVADETHVPNNSVHGAVAIPREHDRLEDAIRAYAALEAKCAIGLSEDVTEEMPEDVVAQVHADVELANTVADHSLGA